MFKFFKKTRDTKETKRDKNAFQTDHGILVFEHTSEVIQAENLLKKNGWDVRVMGPPGDPDRV